MRNLYARERQRNKQKHYRDYWWRFGRDARPAMRKAIAGLDEVLVIALVSKTVMPVRVPTGQVFSNKLVVFATDSFADQAVLSSSMHQMWAIKYGSTMRTTQLHAVGCVRDLPAPGADRSAGRDWARRSTSSGARSCCAASSG